MSVLSIVEGALGAGSPSCFVDEADYQSAVDATGSVATPSSGAFPGVRHLNDLEMRVLHQGLCDIAPNFPED